MHWALAFALFCGVCSIFAFTRHPIYGMYFYLASIYVHPPSRWWGYMLPDLRWSLLSALVSILAVWFHRGKLLPKPESWIASAPAIILTIYTSWMWIESAWALDLPTHLEGTSQYVKYLIAFWFIYRMVDTKFRLVDLMLGHAMGCTLLGIYAQFTGRSGGRLDGVGGPGMDDANTLGMYLATGLVVCVGLVLTQKGWRRWLCLGALPIILNGFVLANSRGAFLGLASGMLVLAICKAREHRRMFWAFIAVAGLGATVIVDTEFVTRMFTIGDVAEQDNEEADVSARSRLVIVEAQMKMAADYPMGVGFRGTVVLSSQYLDQQWLAKLDSAGETSGRSSHNTFMTCLVEQGVPGAIMYICLLIWILLSIVKVYRMNRAGVDPDLATLGGALAGGLIVVIVSGTATDYFLAEVQFWLYAGLISLLQFGEASLSANRKPTVMRGAPGMQQPRIAPKPMTLARPNGRTPRLHE